MRDSATLGQVELRPESGLESLAKEALEDIVEAGQEVMEIHRILAKTGDNVVGELLRGHDTFYEWDHYPPGDVYDHETHAQFYYHTHPPAQRFAGEHGHFHTFVRPKGMPEHVRPAERDDLPEDPDDALSHLIAIAMTPTGLPFRLFTVNRWVTGEVWYSAEDVIAMLPCFDIDHARPSWPVNRWITALLRLYRPQIEELVRARDRMVAAWGHPDRDVLQDRGLEVTSYLDISIEEQVRTAARKLLQGR